MRENTLDSEKLTYNYWINRRSGIYVNSVERRRMKTATRRLKKMHPLAPAADGFNLCIRESNNVQCKWQEFNGDRLTRKFI